MCINYNNAMHTEQYNILYLFYLNIEQDWCTHEFKMCPPLNKPPPPTNILRNFFSQKKPESDYNILSEDDHILNTGYFDF